MGGGSSPRGPADLRTCSIDTVEGEHLIEVFAALAADAVAAEASVSAAEFDALRLSAVAEAATGKRDIELLAGILDTFADGPDGQAVDLFRLYAYKGGQASRRLFQLSREPCCCDHGDQTLSRDAGWLMRRDYLPRPGHSADHRRHGTSLRW
ncbi:hypothetical protein ACWC5C_41400 [Streptomyces sp. NPDC001700]